MFVQGRPIDCREDYTHYAQVPEEGRTVRVEVHQEEKTKCIKKAKYDGCLINDRECLVLKLLVCETHQVMSK